MASAFASHLPQFALRGGGGIGTTDRIRPLGAGEPAKPVDQLAEAEERGRRQARDEARIEFDRARAEDLADFEFRLGEERQRWVDETADRLAEHLTASLTRIETALVETVARILMPFLRSAVRERALHELSETVLAFIRGGRHFALNISGPAELLVRLQLRLHDYADTIAYAADAGPDIRVTIDDTIIETAIAAWIGHIEAAMAGETHG
jgi:hypothetical protein